MTTTPPPSLQWQEEPLRHLPIATTYDLINDLPDSVSRMRAARSGKAFNKQQKEDTNDQ